MFFTKKILRSFRRNFLKYLLVMFVIILGIGVSVAYSNVYESVRYTVTENWKDTNVEDGEFSVYMPLSDDTVSEIEEKGAELENTFYIDLDADDDKTIRMFKVRDKINVLNLHEGSIPENDDEIVLDKVFAGNNSYNVGDNIELDGKEYKICGTVTAVDYLQRIKSLSDAGTDSSFGIGFVNKDEFENIADSNENGIVYNYCYKLDGISDDELKEELFSLDKIETPFSSYDMLYAFNTKENNSRVVYGYEYVKNEKVIGIIAAIAIGILVSYIISLFSVNAINEESANIGLLMAMGYEKRQIAFLYSVLPAVITAVGSIIGCITGRFMTGFLISSTYSYPEMIIRFPVYMLIFAFVIPVIFAFVINYIAVSRRLNHTPLSLMRNEKKTNTKFRNINCKNFITGFRLHHFHSEFKGYVTTAVGMIFALIIMMIGIAMDSTISHFAGDALDDVKYNNMYTLSAQPETKPENAEEGMIKSYSLKYDKTGSYFNIIVAGITPENSYFDVSSEIENLGENEVILSTAVAEKFGYKKDDEFVLSDLLYDKEYKFTVKDITEYSYGFYAFMNLDSMRKYYDVSDEYYNALYASEPLDTEDMKVVFEETNEGIENTVNNWIKLGRSEFIMFSVISVILFVIVTFLLVKSMTEHSLFNISMLKIIGYDNSDISKIYINQNVYIMLFSAFVGLPLSKFIVGNLVNVMTSSMKCYMPAYMGLKQFVTAFVIMIISYIISTLVVKRHLNKVSFADVLKNRE